MMTGRWGLHAALARLTVTSNILSRRLGAQSSVGCSAWPRPLPRLQSTHQRSLSLVGKVSVCSLSTASECFVGSLISSESRSILKTVDGGYQTKRGVHSLGSRETFDAAASASDRNRHHGNTDSSDTSNNNSTVISIRTGRYAPRTVEYFGIRDTVKMLRIYKSLHGDVLVPQLFRVPHTSDWPEKFWNSKLGKRVDHFRQLFNKGKLSKEKVATLEELGFVWNAIDIKYDRLIMALSRYRQLYEHSRVPTTFIVPSESRSWPEELWGYALGRISRLIQLGELKPSQVAAEKLRHVGLVVSSNQKTQHADATGISNSVDDTKGRSGNGVVASNNSIVEVRFAMDLVADNTMEMLRIYKNLHGDLLVPKAFAVPQTADWSENYWGYRLGKRIDHLRQQHSKGILKENRKAELDALGFIWRVFDAKDEQLVAALFKYTELHGHSRVPVSFVVPSGSESWPKGLWDYPLGPTMKRVRVGEKKLSPAIAIKLQQAGLALPKHDHVPIDQTAAGSG